MPNSSTIDRRLNDTENTVLRKNDKPYRADIDGIRSIAILSVVLFHARLPLFSGGFTGVDIFFVISGFLIGGHIYSDIRRGTFTFLTFYQRRVKRILPAFYVVLVFTLLVAVVFLSPFEAEHLGKTAFWSTLSASNILFWQTAGYFDPNSEYNPLLMTWSLGVEEQFYCIIPLILVIFNRIRRTLLLPATLFACVASLSLAAFALGSHPTFVFYMLPCRAWELGIGVALALAEKDRLIALSRPVAEAINLIGVALVVVPILILTVTTPFPGLAALPSVLGTAFVIATPTTWINRRVLSAQPLVFIGKVSYSWYLWHWPLLAYVRILYGNTPPPLAIALTLVLAFLAAVLSYYFVEQPFRSSTVRPGPLVLRYVAASLLVAIACAALWRSQGIPQRSPSLASIETESLSLTTDPCLAPYGKDTPNLSRACFESSPDSPGVAIWGDSHSAALAPGLRAMAASHGYRFTELSKASCPPLLGVSRYLPHHPMLAAECFQFNKTVLSTLQSDAGIRVVALAGFWSAPFHQSQEDGWLVSNPYRPDTSLALEESRQLFAQSLAATIRTLQRAGKTVIVFGDVPEFGVDPLWRIRTSRILVRHTMGSWLGVLEDRDPGTDSPVDVAMAAQSQKLLEDTVVPVPHAAFVDLRREFCVNTWTCKYRNGNSLLYTDPQHLSAIGAHYALRDFNLPDISERDEKTLSMLTVRPAIVTMSH